MVQYRHYWGMPEQQIFEGISALHHEVFMNADHLRAKLSIVPNALVLVASHNEEVVGYKIGYELTKDRYYSWYGAVSEGYRGRGIASELMKKQHQLIAEAGYTILETKTRNKWRNMLIANIKHGFDIVDTFQDDEGIHRITMEKRFVHEDIQ